MVLQFLLYDIRKSLHLWIRLANSNIILQSDAIVCAMCCGMKNSMSNNTLHKEFSPSLGQKKSQRTYFENRVQCFQSTWVCINNITVLTKNTYTIKMCLKNALSFWKHAQGAILGDKTLSFPDVTRCHQYHYVQRSDIILSINVWKKMVCNGHTVSCIL